MSLNRIILLLFCLLCIICKGQIPDSLQTRIKSAPDDSNKVILLNSIGRQYLVEADYPNTMEMATKARDLALAIGYDRGLAIAYTYCGLVNYNWGNYADALSYYFQSLALREKLNDQKGIAATYHNIANVYSDLKNKKDAMRYYSMSAVIKKQMKDTLDSHYAHTVNNMGNIAMMNGKFDEAINYFKRSLVIEEKIDDVYGMIGSYMNMGNLYLEKFDNDKAEKMYLKALQLERELGDKEGLSGIFLDLSLVYSNRGQFDKCRAYLDSGLKLSLETNAKSNIRLAYGKLADLDYKTGNYKRSYELYDLYHKYGDSLLSEQAVKKSLQESMSYEFSKKEAKVKAEQEKNNLEHEAETNKQRIIIFAVCIGLALVLIFSVFLYNRIRVISAQKNIIMKQSEEVEKQRMLANERMEVAENQKKVIEEKQKEILDSIRYAKRIQNALITSQLYIDRTLLRLKNQK